MSNLTTQEDSAEIDRIIQEIEGIEKELEQSSPPPAPAVPASSANVAVSKTIAPEKAGSPSGGAGNTTESAVVAAALSASTISEQPAEKIQESQSRPTPELMAPSPVIPLRPQNSGLEADSQGESLVENDSVIASQASLAPLDDPDYSEEQIMSENEKSNRSHSATRSSDRKTANAGESTLGLRVSGSTAISLEFEKGGVSVQLTCEGDYLTVVTGAGAEFRIPLTGVSARQSSSGRKAA